jgi:hypothetical protein
MNGSTLTLGLVAGLAVLGAARRGSAASSETEARAAAVAEEEARLDGEVRTRQAKLDAARRKPITDDPDWEEWLAHLAARVEEAKADAARYRAMQRERAAGEAARGLDRTFALQSAEALVDAIRAAGGPSQLRVWTKPGLGVRVYFPGEIGHLTVGEDGSISEASRGKVHFLESGLYPAWRKAVREGRRAYLQQLGARLEAAGEARAARVAEVRKGSAMLWTPAELDSQIAQIQRGIARRKKEIAGMEPRAGWGPGYARALSEKREALAYHERELETIRAQRAEWGKGSAARTESGMGRYRFVTNCIGSTYEDIRALKETATGVTRATFAKALGPEQWKWVQKSLGYDRDFSISRDWHVGYDKGTYRGVPAYWITHSGIEWIFTLDGEQGKSLGRRGSRSAGGTYFHVTTIDGANAILRDGFRAGPGICGRGVYLWDDLWYAQQMAQDEGDDAVILAVNPEDTELYACDEADVQDEGDSAYYDHVVIARVKSRWKPKMRVVE